MLVSVKVVVVELDGMVLSDSVESDMLKLDMVGSAVDIEEDGSVKSEAEVDSEAIIEEVVFIS